METLVVIFVVQSSLTEQESRLNQTVFSYSSIPFPSSLSLLGFSGYCAISRHLHILLIGRDLAHFDVTSSCLPVSSHSHLIICFISSIHINMGSLPLRPNAALTSQQAVCLSSRDSPQSIALFLLPLLLTSTLTPLLASQFFDLLALCHKDMAPLYPLYPLLPSTDSPPLRCRCALH